MSKPYPELTEALSRMLDKIDGVLRDAGYAGEPVKMFLAGGMAVNYWCGSRYTEDVDASFSKRILLPYDEMIVDYTRADGEQTYIYFDPNYNTSFALWHEDFEDDAVEWDGIQNERRKVRLYVLNPTDLAVSKIARFTDQDREDIKSLASMGLISSKDVKKRAEEAISYYVGYAPSVRTSINLAVKDIESLEHKPRVRSRDIDLDR